MALSDPRSIFGVHSFSPYDRDTGLFHGTVKVLETSNLALSGETIDLLGGSNRFPWASETGAISAELSLTFSQYEDFLFELFLGNAPTSNAAEATGNVSTITNKSGTSAVNATTGIASVAATGGDEGDLKFGKYVIKVEAGGTDISIYLSSDADIARGNDESYDDDELLVESGITIPSTGGTVAVANLGLTFTGGSGTVAMTVGDTATFSVRPPNSGSMDVTIGGAANQNFSEWGAILMAQKRGNEELFEIDVFRAIAAGLPINFSRFAWSQAEVTAKCLYDSGRDGVFSVRHVKPT